MFLDIVNENNSCTDLTEDETFLSNLLKISI